MGVEEKRYSIAKKVAASITRYAMSNGGKSMLEGFEDFLQFGVYAWLTEKKSWKEVKFERTAKEFAELEQIFIEYSNGMKELLENNGWSDLIGYIYEDFARGGQQKAFNQFFTPEHVCTLMAKAIYEKFDLDTCNKLLRGTYTALDPTAGSGRLLLAYHAHIIKTYSCIGVPYMIAEDLSRTATFMTTLNFLMHGCVGEVINHDTLTEPDTMRFGFFVNRHMYEKEHKLFGLPHVEIITDCTDTKFYKVGKAQHEQRQASEEEHAEAIPTDRTQNKEDNTVAAETTETEPLPKPAKAERVQLELF